MTETAAIEVPVHQPDEVLPDLKPADLPKDTTTALDRIKAKIAEDRLKDARTKSFKLPVSERPYVVVDYGPVLGSQWNGLQRKAIEVEMSDVEMQARGLSLFVRGVYLKLDDGTLVSADLNDPDKPAPKFEQRLAESLGIPWPGLAHEMVQALYVLDGEVASTALALLALSGFGRAQEVASSAEGN